MISHRAVGLRHGASVKVCSTARPSRGRWYESSATTTYVVAHGAPAVAIFLWQILVFCIAIRLPLRDTMRLNRGFCCRYARQRAAARRHECCSFILQLMVCSPSHVLRHPAAQTFEFYSVMASPPRNVVNACAPYCTSSISVQSVPAFQVCSMPVVVTFFRAAAFRSNLRSCPRRGC